jgi:hypothetical protein
MSHVRLYLSLLMDVYFLGTSQSHLILFILPEFMNQLWHECKSVQFVLIYIVQLNDPILLDVGGT